MKTFLAPSLRICNTRSWRIFTPFRSGRRPDGNMRYCQIACFQIYRCFHERLQRRTFLPRKVYKIFALVCAAEKDNYRSIVFHRRSADRFLNVVPHPRECQLFRAYLSVTWGGSQHEIGYNFHSTHVGLQPSAAVCGNIWHNVAQAGLGCSVFRLYLDADAFEKGGRQNPAGAHNDRIVPDSHLSLLLLDIDVMKTDPLDAGLK
jgi:hypothetical protein